MTDPDRVSFRGRRCPPGFVVRTLVLQPGDAIDYHAADWADALLVVESGALEVECGSGTRARFDDGAVVAFGGLDLRRMRNGGDSPLVLSALSRHRRAE